MKSIRKERVRGIYAVNRARSPLISASLSKGAVNEYA